ncbi:glycoside hydrolase family 2 TIM barrel-domain containing protein [Candidatus Auribacterota bacterium]
MKNIIKISIVIILLSGGVALSGTSARSSGQPVVKVQGRDLYVDLDGNNKYEPYLVKGVGYQPTPIGTRDYLPNDPRVYDRDFALLKKMNCNTIRTWTEVNKVLMDSAAKWGIKVIAGFKSYSDKDELSDPVIKKAIKKKFRTYVKKYHAHPALLFWAVGNEDNYHYKGKDKKDFYVLMNELGGVVRSIEGNSSHPVAIVNGYLGNIGQKGFRADDASLSNIDIWGVNVYTGYSFYKDDGTDFFDSYANLSQKPLWIAEYGIDAWDDINNKEQQEKQAEWVCNNWDEIEASAVCIGATVMAYSDEWWKGGNIDRHDHGGYSTKQWGNLHPDHFSNEEWWGVVAVEKKPNKIDRVIPRKVYYELKEKWK